MNKVIEFKTALTSSQEKAVNQAKRLKAYKIANWDHTKVNTYKCYFDYIWYNVLKEIDLQQDNEDTPLTQQQAITAAKWILENQYLTKEFKTMKL
jgi:hypothetical protein